MPNGNMSAAQVYRSPGIQTALAIDSEGTPYVAYVDSGEITVMKFNDNNWETVGNARFTDLEAILILILLLIIMAPLMLLLWMNMTKPILHIMK